MSFIGSGELEHKVTQLQRQLDHKDHELNSIKNEQRKSQEELAAAKRAKEDAEYKLRDEADRALKAETAISSKSTEISQLKLKLSNLESSLTQTSDRLKKEERDKDRIQDALDEALSSGADGAARHVRDLQIRTKQLEEALKAAEQGKEQLRSQGQGSSTDAWGSGENQVDSLRDENKRLQALSSKSASSDPLSAASPSRSRTKRRSMSVSGPSAESEMVELENQISSLREQLVSRKRDLDKAVNEKLAVEIGARKKTEKLENEIEEIKEELDYYRSNGTSGDSKELEKVKKAMQAEKQQLSARLREKEEEVESKVQQLKKMEKIVERVYDLEAEVERERQARRQLEESAPSPFAAEDSDSRAKIESLEAELVKLRLQPQMAQAGKGSSSDLRQIRRELQKAISEKEYLETLVKENDELLAEKDEEVDRLRTAIPIPGSPSLAPRDDGRMEELQLEKAVLQEQVEVQKERFEEKIKGLEGKMIDISEQLEKAKAAEADLSDKADDLRQELENATTERDALVREHKVVQEKLSETEERISQISEESSRLSEEIQIYTQLAQTAQTAAADVEARYEELKTSVDEKNALLDDLVKQRDQLEAQLSQKAEVEQEREVLAHTVAERETRLNDIKEALTAAELARDELQDRVVSIQEERDLYIARSETSETQLAEARSRADDAEKAVDASNTKSEEAIRTLSEQVEDLKVELSAVQLKLDDKIAELAVSAAAHDDVQNRFEEAVKAMNELQATVSTLEEAQADRSTESDSRVKDEQLFALQEEKRALEQNLEETKKSYEKEIDASTFKGEQDLVEARQRISTLEVRITELQTSLASATSESLRRSKPSSANEEEVRRFEQKVALLRSERDELRHTVSFVQNERHFAVRALASEKDSALEDVKRVRDELKSRTTLCEKLQAEVDGTKAALDEAKQVSKGMLSAREKGELIERLTALEKELEGQTERIHDLQEQLRLREEAVKSAESRATAAEIKAEGFQKELLDMVNHVGQMAKLNDQPRLSPTTPTFAEEAGDVPSALVAPLAGGASGSERTRRPSLGHTRSRSSMSGPSVQILMLEEQMKSRIQRRDARIAELTHDLEKANMNLTLAREAQEETLEEVAELTEEKESLEAQLQAMSHQQVAQPSEQEADVDIDTVRSLVLSLAIYRKNVRSAERRWSATRSILAISQSTVEKLRASLVSAVENSASQKQRFATLEQERAGIEARLASSADQEAALRTELEAAKNSIERLQSRLSIAESAGETVVETAQSLSALEAQMAEKEERIREFKVQNGELSARLEVLEKELADVKSAHEAELSILSDKVKASGERDERSQETIRALESEKEGLMEEIAAAEKALEEGLADAQSQQEAVENTLRDVEGKVQVLQSQLAEKEKSTEEMVKRSEQLAKSLEEAVAKSLETDVASQLDAATIEQLRRDVDDANSRVRESEALVEQLRAELADVYRSVEVAQGEKEALEADTDELRRTASAVVDVMAGKDQEIRSLQAEVGAIEGHSSALRQEVSLARGEQKDAQRALGELKKEMAGLSTTLSLTQQELAVARELSEAAVRDATAKQVEVDRLRQEIAALENRHEEALAKAEAVPAAVAEPAADMVDEAIVTELKERIDEIEAALSQKTEEVDEADDRTREAFKANAKLEKKIGKLQRQLEAAQVAANTAANKYASMAVAVEAGPAPLVASVAPAPAQAPSAMIRKSAPAPAPVPSPSVHVAAPVQSTAQPSLKPRVVSAPASTPSQTSHSQPARTPLSSVHNLFGPAHANVPVSVGAAVPTPSSGHKRHREADEVELVKPAEAIMVPASISPRKPLGLGVGAKPKSSFTPQRGISLTSTGGGGNVNVNVFAPKPTSTGKSVNVFQSTTERTRTGPSFPLPPSRNVFQGSK